MKISNKKIQELTFYQPEVIKTLLYLMAFSDENGFITLDTDLMCEVLKRDSNKNDDYINRTVNAGLIKQTYKAERGNIIYKILSN